VETVARRLGLRRSGTPVTRYGYSSAYKRYEFFLTSRGAEGRRRANYDADVHLGYPIAFGRSHLNILLDVFNILNTQRAVLLDERYSFQEEDNGLPKSANATYLKPVVRTPATSARLGVRWNILTARKLEIIEDSEAPEFLSRPTRAVRVPCR